QSGVWSSPTGPFLPCGPRGPRHPRGDTTVTRNPRGRSLDRDPIPVDLLPIAAQAEDVEHRLEVELGRALEGLAVDAELRPAPEVDQTGTQPDVEPPHALEIEPDQVAQVAGGHLDLGGVEILPQDLGGLRRRGAARRELAGHDAVEAIVGRPRRDDLERLG